MNERRIDELMEEVLAKMANPPVPLGWENRLEETRMRNNVLVFGAVEKTRMSKPAVTTAVLLNVAAMLVVLFVSARKVGLIAPRALEAVVLTAPVPPPPPPQVAPKLQAMGGGGGNPGATPVTRGVPPKFAPQLVPLKAPQALAPRLAVEPAVDVQADVRMAKSDVPNFGVPNSPLVGMSLGNGKGGGIGSGSGDGIGVGSGGGMGGGIRKIGGGVSAPVVLFAPEPEFSDEARKAKVAGNVIVYLQVDAQGKPQHVRVLRGIGLGLDEKAVAAVKAYKFKPAMENGHPVAVEMNVDVGFQIF